MFTVLHTYCSKSKTKTMAAENYRISAKDSFEEMPVYVFRVLADVVLSVNNIVLRTISVLNVSVHPPECK